MVMMIRKSAPSAPGKKQRRTAVEIRFRRDRHDVSLLHHLDFLLSFSQPVTGRYVFLVVRSLFPRRVRNKKQNCLRFWLLSSRALFWKPLCTIYRYTYVSQRVLSCAVVNFLLYCTVFCYYTSVPSRVVNVTTRV